MAKNKKRKKVQAPRPKTQLSFKFSKSHLEECYATTRRIFRAVGEDPALLDAFAKRHRQNMFRVTMLPPRVAPMPGHLVPRQYIRYVQEELHYYLRNRYFDEEAGVTWMDIVTTGDSLHLLFQMDSFLDALPDNQRAIAERLNRVFEEQEIFFKAYQFVSLHVKTMLMMLSQPNFRIYGQDSMTKSTYSHSGVVQIVQITTHESQSLRFNYHNRERKAFRLAVGQYIEEPYTGAKIALSKIYPGVEKDRILDIYIQSHAIHRFKERIDTFYPIMRNQFFVISLMLAQRVIQGPGGTQLIACIAPQDGEEKVIGYFTFTIDGNNLLVVTLLPLLSRDVPEGRILYERLRLSSEDLKYLGMDRLSFFYDVDIEQIPALKQVLFDELRLDYVRTVYNSFRPKDAPFNEKKTQFVKDFFRKLEEQPAGHAEVLDALNEAELLDAPS
jgi:hypothetical protein